MSFRGAMRSACDLAGKSFLCLGRRLLPTNAELRITDWLRDEAEDRLRLDYGLDTSSLVVDVGGYRGRWASDIYSRFSCRVLVFEPIADFAAKLRWRFEPNAKITVHPFGLSDRDRQATMYMNEDGSSLLDHAGGKNTSVSLRRAADVFNEERLTHIDLMKINIEGGEYDLLDHLHESGWIPRIRDLQIQFHDFHRDSARRMQTIQEKLAVTHRLTYSYPFVWENWRLCSDER